MLTVSRDRNDTSNAQENEELTQRTMHTYKLMADTQAKKADLDEAQVQQMENSWTLKVAGETKNQQRKGAEENEEHAKDHVKEVQQVGEEFKEMIQQVDTCDPNSVIHSAKIKRLGESHIGRAKSYATKIKAEVRRAKLQQTVAR